MTLQEGIKLQGAPVVINSCGRENLPKFFYELGYRRGAEIGVWKGEFTEKFCQAGLEMYAVDPWMGFSGQGRHQQFQDVQNSYYDQALARLAPYKNCTIVRKTSLEAVKDFPDGDLDFVYIDGDHSFQHIANDLCEWQRKVRKGGMVSGHDYFNTDPAARNVICQVGVVVDAYTKAFGISPWWVFGELDPEKEPNRKERFLSWMWFKK